MSDDDKKNTCSRCGRVVESTVSFSAVGMKPTPPLCLWCLKIRGRKVIERAAHDREIDNDVPDGAAAELDLAEGYDAAEGREIDRKGSRKGPERPPFGRMLRVDASGREGTEMTATETMPRPGGQGMHIYTMPQGSAEWLAIRSTMPTASEFSQLVSPAKLKVREGKAIGSYVATKLAEKWLGSPLEGFAPTANMDQGTIRETEAWPWYALEYDRDMDHPNPGFIVAEDGRCGCSPDGILVAERFGLEIKCPDADTHVGYLLGGNLPNEYIMQVQGSMLVTGFDSWTFLSYRPRFPQLVIDVPRDEEVIAAIREGLNAYWRMFETGWKRLVVANGGVAPEQGAAHD